MRSNQMRLNVPEAWVISVAIVSVTLLIMYFGHR
jgi:hypothetical protein